MSSLTTEMQIGVIPMVVNLATFNKTAYSCTFWPNSSTPRIDTLGTTSCPQGYSL